MPATVELQGIQDLPCSIEDAFDFVADMTNDPKWCDWVASAKLVNGDKPAKGAVFEIEQVMSDGSQVPMQFTIVEFERPKRLRWRMDNDIFDYYAEMDFEPTDTGTRIVQRNKNTFKPMPAEAAPEIQKMVEGNMHKQMANLVAALT